MTATWIGKGLASALLGLAATTMVVAASSVTVLPRATRGETDADQQIAAGQAVYETICSLCHGLSGEGGEGPQLVGPLALRSFRTAKRVFDYARISMPGDDPGSLSLQEYYDVIAFLLDQNELNPDGVVVDAESIEDIALQ